MGNSSFSQTLLSLPVTLANGGTGVSLTDPGADRILFWDDSAGNVTWLTAGTGLAITGTTIAATGGTGTVTDLSVVTANGVSGSVATSTTTPAITLTLGAITPTTINGLTISSTTGTFTLTNGKTLSVLKTISLTAADDTGVYTLPTGTKTLVATDVATLSSLASIGTITTGVWTGTTIAVANGGTGQTSYTDGQLLIGNTTGNTLAKATLTGTSNQITVTNGSGTITLSTPQNIGTGSTPTFAGISLSAAATITSNSATALAVGPNGTTTPSFTVDAATASAATGIKITAAAAGGSVVLAVTSSTNDTLIIRSAAAGAVSLQPGTDGTSAINFRKANSGSIYLRGDSTNLRVRIGDGTAPVTTLDVVGKFQVNSSGLIPTYNSIATVSGGVPSELATIDSTGLTANVAAATLYAVPSTGEGLYRVSAYLVTTTAASVSSTMPNAQVVYTDKDSNTAVTLDVSPILGAAGLGQSGTLAANTVGTVFSGTIVIYVKASTTIQYQTVNYASTIAGMAYALRIKLEAL